MAAPQTSRALPTAPAAEASSDRPRPHYGLTFGTLVTAVLAYSLMQSLVAPALLQIQRDVNTTTAGVTWVLTGYLLAASVATPIVSRLGDIFGKRLVLICVLLSFTAGTLVCALATTIEQLIAGRVVQGAGGALFALSVGIIRDEFPPRRVVAGVSILSGIIGTGSSLGIVLAGPITDHLSYHWLFWLPLVPLAGATVACFLVVPESPRRERVPIDWLGGVLLASWLVCVLIGVTEASSWGWGSSRVLGLFAVGAVLFCAWVAVEMRMTHPLIDMKLMRRRGVWTSNAAAFLVGFGMFTGFLLVPQFAEAPESTGYGFGASVTVGSLLLVPLSLAMLVTSMVVGRILPRVGPKRLIVGGAALTSLGLAAFVPWHGTELQVAFSTTLVGIGIGMAYASLANQVIAWVPSTHTSVAVGMNAIVRFTGGAFGAQVSASILAATVGASGYPSLHGFEVAFTLGALAAAGGVVVAAMGPSRDNDAVRAGRGAQQSEPNSA